MHAGQKLLSHVQLAPISKPPEHAQLHGMRTDVEFEYSGYFGK